MNKDNLDLTIVVPTLNTGATLQVTLESIKPLQDRGAQIIVVDSYSTDETISIAENYADDLLQHPKGNMYSAINEGIKHSNTSWVSYLNADDILYSKTVIHAMKKYMDTAELIYGDIDFVDWDGRFLHSYIFSQPNDIIALATCHINSISPIGTFFRKDLWEKLNGFDTNYRFSADFDFFLRAALAKAKLKKIKALTVGAFRLHPSQLSQGKENPCLIDSRNIVKNLELSVPFLKKLSAKIRLKTNNIQEFLIRVIRHRKLTQGSTSFTSIKPPDYRSSYE